jgi:hypothetical protein
LCLMAGHVRDQGILGVLPRLDRSPVTDARRVGSRAVASIIAKGLRRRADPRPSGRFYLDRRPADPATIALHCVPIGCHSIKVPPRDRARERNSADRSVC